jgi:DNA-binding LacI/PurR family transcriptional regulator
MLLENRAAGMIITPAEGDADHLKALVDSGTPVVFIDRKVEGIDTDYVINDIVSAGRIATEHLIRLGHRRIGHISGAKEYEYITAFQDIIAGYRQAHKEGELAVDEDLIKFGGLDIESGQRVMGAFLEMNEPPTAVFCVNDLTALGAMAAVYEAGLRVPQDVAIVGIDDIEVSALPYIGLTTVSQPEYEIGRIAAQIILERIGGRYQKGSTKLRRKRIVLKPKLMIRNSCGGRLLGKGGEKPSRSVDFD